MHLIMLTKTTLLYMLPLTFIMQKYHIVYVKQVHEHLGKYSYTHIHSYTHILKGKMIQMHMCFES